MRKKTVSAKLMRDDFGNRALGCDGCGALWNVAMEPKVPKHFRYCHGCGQEIRKSKEGA